MARNIEIKAHARDFRKQTRIAAKLGNGKGELILQEDTFFNVPAGRLKLRVFDDGTGELIQYERKDSRGPSESNYLLSPSHNPESLRAALTEALGVRAVVRKHRMVYFCGQTRIHLDLVEGLGSYIELEVVLEDGQRFAEGAAIAEELMALLEIDKNDLVDTAYVDLLLDKSARPKRPGD
jgi:predicted adenylyl cyclase CyaB